MKLFDLGEFGLIRRIRKLSSGAAPSVLIGIGDDAAALNLSPGHTLLVTTDLLLEDVHFDLSYTDFYSLGWKSAAVNLSDIAAMGGTPRFCLTALGIPRGIAAEDILDFYHGFKDLLRLQQTELIGGDTCASRDRLFISVTALGEAKAARIITRSGARPGDRVFVTGTLGDSAAGLEILQKGTGPVSGTRGQRNNKRVPRTAQTAAAQLIERHLRPRPRVKEGRLIAASGCASAMIDISDGLSSDLSHLCNKSGVGADIVQDSIPVSEALKSICGARSRGKKVELMHALNGGEDYELLFTVPPARMSKLRSLKLPVKEIGKITARRTMSLLDDAGRTRLQPKGYDHFGNIRAGRRRNQG